jgi:hypothetical protein
VTTLKGGDTSADERPRGNPDSIGRGEIMSKATTEDWSRYYAVAARRRRQGGGDPFTNYTRRKASQQKALFIGSSLFLAGLVSVLYSVLTS